MQAELTSALQQLLKAFYSLLPGVRFIAVQDYQILNEAPIAANKALTLAGMAEAAAEDDQ